MMKQRFLHDLGHTQAKDVVSAAFESYRQTFAQYHPSLVWIDDKRAQFFFKVKVAQVHGYMHVGDRSIDVELEVPWLLRAFKQQAIEVITREIALWIKRAQQAKVPVPSKPSIALDGT